MQRTLLEAPPTLPPCPEPLTSSTRSQDRILLFLSPKPLLCPSPGLPAPSRGHGRAEAGGRSSGLLGARREGMRHVGGGLPPAIGGQQLGPSQGTSSGAGQLREGSAAGRARP